MVKRRLLTQRADTERTLHRLRTDHASIVEQVLLEAPDDEHDPDGATLGWERQKLAALIDHEASRLVEIDAALAALADGTWGVCRSCGRAIGDERLEARPAAATCIACAT